MVKIVRWGEGGTNQLSLNILALNLFIYLFFTLGYVVINSLPFNICKIDTTSHQFKPKKKEKKRCIFHI